MACPFYLQVSSLLRIPTVSCLSNEPPHLQGPLTPEAKPLDPPGPMLGSPQAAPLANGMPLSPAGESHWQAALAAGQDNVSAWLLKQALEQNSASPVPSSPQAAPLASCMPSLSAGSSLVPAGNRLQ